MIGLKFPLNDLSSTQVKSLKAALSKQNKKYIRVPGESKTGPCPFCAQFFFMEHDGTGKIVPLPRTGTHKLCVCSDVPVNLINLLSKAGLESLIGFDNSFKLRSVKKSAKRFEWLSYQSKGVKESILGAVKAGFLPSVKLDDLYKNDGRIKTNKQIKSLKKRRKNK